MEDIISHGKYALLSFVSKGDALLLSATSKCMSSEVKPWLKLCSFLGNLKWISGHEASFLDGHPSLAKYSDISGLAILPNNNFLVADSHNNVVRIVSKESADILTVKVNLPRGICVEHDCVYLACLQGIYTFSLSPLRLCSVIRHVPSLYMEMAEQPPYQVAKTSNHLYVTDLSSTLHVMDCNTRERRRIDLPNATLTGVCKAGDGVYVCDYTGNAVWYVDTNTQTLLYTVPRPRCVCAHQGSVWVSSDDEKVWMFTPRTFKALSVPISPRALALTSAGVPILATFSALFSLA
jgi:DNA-binding beta-propeller fold protein YncE